MSIRSFTIILSDLLIFTLKQEPKMSIGSQDYIFRMSTVYLKVPFNASCKVVDNACMSLLGNRLSLFSDSCLQGCNGARVAWSMLSLKNSSRNKSCGFRSSVWGAYTTSALHLMWCSPNFLSSHAMIKLVLWCNNWSSPSSSSCFSSSLQNCQGIWM